MASFPARPKLADHALARWHVASGEELVLLHDTRTGRTVRLGAGEWRLLEAADGTRDLEGILLAAARAGAYARAPALRGFLEGLHGAGLLADGASDPGPSETAAPPEDAGERRIEPLPGFTLRCDGRGSCCRLYASIVFSPLEAARARAHLPLVRDGGAQPMRAFTPEHGSSLDAAFAVALEDGRCSYLGAEGRCGVHAAAGAEAKPLGCRLYPATFVDDGEVVRASIGVECACVLASEGATDGEPIVPPGVALRRDLPAGAFVSTLPHVVSVAPGLEASRADLRAWSRAAAEIASIDGVARYWSLARDVERGGLAVGDAAPGSPDPAAIAPWIEALARRAEQRTKDDPAIRSERDLVRRSARWIHRAAGSLLDRAALTDALAHPVVRDEALHLRATLHGHHLVSGDLPLAAALRDRAVRLLVARAMPAVVATEGDEDPAARHPLALVEAMLRGHGLDAYAHDLV